MQIAFNSQWVNNINNIINTAETQIGFRCVRKINTDEKISPKRKYFWYYLPTPPLGQDMTQGQFLSGV